MNVLVITSATPNSNTERLVEMFSSIVYKFRGEVFVLPTKNITHPCMGCKTCTACCVEDEFTEKVIRQGFKFDCVVFAGAVYFFDLNSNLRKALERFYCYDLTDVPLGLILTSGSNFRYGGVDLIINQFKRIDEYCGSKTVTPYNKVTFDERTPVNELDVLGLKKLYSDLEYEVMLNEAKKVK